MTDKTLGAYERHESPDYADGGMTAAAIEREAENHGGTGCKCIDDMPPAMGGGMSAAKDTAIRWMNRGAAAEKERDRYRDDANGWKATAESWQATAEEWEARAVKAEEHVEDLSHDLEAARAEMAACDVHSGVIEVTGDMRAAARAAFTEHTGIPTLSGEGGSSADFIGEGVHLALTAALTSPPARPEGAEAVAALLTEYATDHPGGSDWERVADFLASRGVRVEGSGR